MRFIAGVTLLFLALLGLGFTWGVAWSYNHIGQKYQQFEYHRELQ